MVSRRGVTLLELMVALAVAGVALSLIAAISARQQRIVAGLTDRAVLWTQLGDAASILPIDLRSASPAGGDIRDARDTSVQLRASIATAVVCDVRSGTLVLAPASPGADTYGSVLSPIKQGDTAWLFTPGDSADGWQGYGIDAATMEAPGPCAISGPLLTGSARLLPRIGIRLDGASRSTIGMPVRVTRELRYSLYRGSDRAWYLGQRDWNASTLRFNTIQPVAGPFLPPRSGGRQGGLEFRYVDTIGNVVSVPVADTRALSMIRIDLRGETRSAERSFSSAAVDGKRLDSIGVWVLLRNRK